VEVDHPRPSQDHSSLLCLCQPNSQHALLCGNHYYQRGVLLYLPSFLPWAT
jgi:hypothetical protein